MKIAREVQDEIEHVIQLSDLQQIRHGESAV